jgi:4-hydroxybenzoate polyprenyltransferase
MTYRSDLPALDRDSPLRALIESLRLHQWTKNLLVFVPAILSNRFSDWSVLNATSLAFFGLCFVASATYLINDLVDTSNDRRHPSKRYRAVASGRLPVADALTAALLGLLLGLGLAWIAGAKVLMVACAYVAITLAYSGGLKRIPIFDAFTLAALFTLRLALGIVSSGAPPSPWLLVFSMFLFGSLSFAKRYTEIRGVIAAGGTEIEGRGYRASDLPLVLATGVAAGLGAVLIMVLYIIDDAFHQSFYGNTSWLWGFPCLLFLFVSRLWLVCQRGELDDDPIVFAVKDPVTLAIGGGLLGCFIMAWGGVGA